MKNGMRDSIPILTQGFILKGTVDQLEKISKTIADTGVQLIYTTTTANEKLYITRGTRNE